jgi:hypothetical protein
MRPQKKYRILTPDGALSDDAYILAPHQPFTIKADCVLAVDEYTGDEITVHETRLFPDHDERLAPAAERPMSVCLKCGRVEGVVEDQVSCPYREDSCGMVETAKNAPACYSPAT